jgi:hypothetical protein
MGESQDWEDRTSFESMRDKRGIKENHCSRHSVQLKRKKKKEKQAHRQL